MLVKGLLKFSAAVDWVSAQFAVVANWLVLVCCLISAGNAASQAVPFTSKFLQRTPNTRP